MFPKREHLLFINTFVLRIIAKRTLREFWDKHPDCIQALKAWHREVDKANWANAHDIKRYYPSASVLGEGRVVFNIKGNKYRLIVKCNFDFQIIWIRFIGTHAEYDKIDASSI